MLSYQKESTRRGEWWALSDKYYVPVKVRDDYKVSGRAFKNNVEEFDIRSLDLGGNLFNMPFPLGEILFEDYVKNEEGVIDENLKEINKIPEYISFVNEVQELVFNGTRKSDGQTKIYTRTYDVKNQSDPEKGIIRRYRFFG